MRRRMLFAALAVGLVFVMMLPVMAVAQGRHPGPGPGRGHGGPTVVVRGGYWGGWGYPYYSPFWGFYPWYGYYGWGPGYGWGGYEPTGSVRLEVTPKQAQVFVDGYYVGVVDDFDGTFQRLNLPPGGHELVLYLDGFRSVRQSFYVTTGRDFKVKFAMVPLAPGEAAEPRPTPVNPPAAETPPPSWNGAPPRAGQPPAPWNGAPPRASQPPPPTSETRGFGTLVIQVQPSDAEIVVDGDRWRGPESQERMLIQVAEGSHRVEVQKAGYVTFSTDIQVRRGETATLNVSLPPRDPQ